MLTLTLAQQLQLQNYPCECEADAIGTDASNEKAQFFEQQRPPYETPGLKKRMLGLKKASKSVEHAG